MRLLSAGWWSRWFLVLRLRPYVWRRVAAALDALKTGLVAYLQDGYSR
jgi:hypothetical protein